MKDAPTEAVSATCRSKHTGSRDQSSRSRQRHQGLGPSNQRSQPLLKATPSGQWKFLQMQPSVVLLSRDLFLADEIERLKISGSKKETAIILYFTGVAYG
jgi:hypothetical protein